MGKFYENGHSSLKLSAEIADSDQLRDRNKCNTRVRKIEVWNKTNNIFNLRTILRINIDDKKNSGITDF